MSEPLFKGVLPALVTPFRDGGGVEEALRRLIEWHIEQGTPVLSPVGTTGESPTLSHDEHDRVIALVIEAVAGRARVMAGTGSNSTAEATPYLRPRGKASPPAVQAGGTHQFSVRSGPLPVLRVSCSSPCSVTSRVPARGG